MEYDISQAGSAAVDNFTTAVENDYSSSATEEYKTNKLSSVAQDKVSRLSGRSVAPDISPEAAYALSSFDEVPEGTSFSDDYSSNLSALTNTVRGGVGAFASTVVNLPLQLASTLESAATYGSSKYLYGKSDEDAYKDAQVASFYSADTANDLTHMLQGEQFTRHHAAKQSEFDKTFKESGLSDFDIFNPSESLDKLDGGKVVDTVKTAFSDVDSTVDSLGHVAGFLLGIPEKGLRYLMSSSVGKVTAHQAAKKELSKLIDKAAKTETKISTGSISKSDVLNKGIVINSIDDLSKAAKAKYITFANPSVEKEVTKQLAKSTRVLDNVGTGLKTRAWILNNSNNLALASDMSLQDLDEYQKKYGDMPTLTHALLGYGANFVGAKLELWSDKLALAGTPQGVSELVAGMGKTKAKKFVTGLVAGSLSMLEGGIAEFPAEFVQSAIQSFDSSYKDESTFTESVKKAFNDGLKGSIYGLSSGVHMSTPRASIKPFTNMINSGTSNTYDAVNTITSDNGVSLKQSIANETGVPAEDHNVVINSIETAMNTADTPVNELFTPDELKANRNLVDNYVLTLGDEVKRIDSIISDDNNELTEEDKTNLLSKRNDYSAGIAKFMEMREYLEDPDTGYTLNSRPVSSIEKDLMSVSEQLKESPSDNKLNKLKRYLEIEKYVAEHPAVKSTGVIGDSGVDTVGDDIKSSINTTRIQGLFGGYTDDGYRTGIMHMIKPLLNQDNTKEQTTAAVNNINRFIGSQVAKYDALIKSKDKYESNGNVPVKVNYKTPKGTVHNVVYNGKQSDSFLKNIKTDIDLYNNILEMALGKPSSNGIDNNTRTSSTVQATKSVDNYDSIPDNEKNSIKQLLTESANNNSSLSLNSLLTKSAVHRKYTRELANKLGIKLSVRDGSIFVNTEKPTSGNTATKPANNIVQNSSKDKPKSVTDKISTSNVQSSNKLSSHDAKAIEQVIDNLLNGGEDVDVKNSIVAKTKLHKNYTKKVADKRGIKLFINKGKLKARNGGKHETSNKGIKRKTKEGTTNEKRRKSVTVKDESSYEKDSLNNAVTRSNNLLNLNMSTQELIDVLIDESYTQSNLVESARVIEITANKLLDTDNSISIDEKTQLNLLVDLANELISLHNVKKELTASANKLNNVRNFYVKLHLNNINKWLNKYTDTYKKLSTSSKRKATKTFNTLAGSRIVSSGRLKNTKNKDAVLLGDITDNKELFNTAMQLSGNEYFNLVSDTESYSKRKSSIESRIKRFRNEASFYSSKRNKQVANLTSVKDSVASKDLVDKYNVSTDTLESLHEFLGGCK